MPVDPGIINLLAGLASGFASGREAHRARQEREAIRTEEKERWTSQMQRQQEAAEQLRQYNQLMFVREAIEAQSMTPEMGTQFLQSRGVNLPTMPVQVPLGPPVEGPSRGEKATYYPVKGSYPTADAQFISPATKAYVPAVGPVLPRLPTVGAGAAYLPPRERPMETALTRTEQKPLPLFTAPKQKLQEDPYTAYYDRLFDLQQRGYISPEEGTRVAESYKKYALTRDPAVVYAPKFTTPPRQPRAGERDTFADLMGRYNAYDIAIGRAYDDLKAMRKDILIAQGTPDMPPEAIATYAAGLPEILNQIEQLQSEKAQLGKLLEEAARQQGLQLPPGFGGRPPVDITRKVRLTQQQSLIRLAQTGLDPRSPRTVILAAEQTREAIRSELGDEAAEKVYPLLGLQNVPTTKAPPKAAKTPETPVVAPAVTPAEPATKRGLGQRIGQEALKLFGQPSDEEFRAYVTELRKQGRIKELTRQEQRRLERLSRTAE